MPGGLPTSSPDSTMRRRVAAPTPRTRSRRSSRSTKGPRSRSATMRAAMAGPMPRTDSSSAREAVFASTAGADAGRPAPRMNSRRSRIATSAGNGMAASWLRGTPPARHYARRRGHRHRPEGSALRIGREPADVARHALLDRGEARGVAGGAQPRQVAAREALVLALERIGEIDVLDQAGRHHARQVERRLAAQLPQGGDHGARDVVERLRPAGAAVEDAAHRRVVEAVQVDRDDVVHMDEVARLFARAVAVMGAEQPDAAVGDELVVVVERHRRHPALVRLARAVDIEIAQADHLALRALEAAPHDLVEEQLRVPVD